MEENEDARLGGAARLLLRRGQHDAAALLALVEDAVISQWDSWREGSTYRLWLRVPPENEKDFTEEMIAVITSALDDLTQMEGEHVESIQVLPSIPLGGEWRQEVQEHLSGKPVNQASLVVLPDPFITEDRMRFRSPAELVVYRALKRQQNLLPVHTTIGVAPGCLFRVAGHTWEPDFLVTYKGRCGVIFVDGLHHRGRRAVDHSQDRLYENAGVTYIERMPVEETNDTADVEQLIERFLYRLSEA